MFVRVLFSFEALIKGYVQLTITVAGDAVERFVLTARFLVHGIALVLRARSLHCIALFLWA